MATIEENLNKQNQLQKELDESKVKTCVDIPSERVIIFVTDKHLLICDKMKKKNQLLIPYAEFIKRFDDVEVDDSGTETEITDMDKNRAE